VSWYPDCRLNSPLLEYIGEGCCEGGGVGGGRGGSREWGVRGPRGQLVVANMKMKVTTMKGGGVGGEGASEISPVTNTNGDANTMRCECGAMWC
jgi:hypothetical protein